MRKKTIWLAGAVTIALAAVIIIVWQVGRAKGGDLAVAGASNIQPADPQKLLIPRWFLSSIIVDGSTIQVPEQTASIQFQPGGKTSGIGGCNEFSTSYEAGIDGRMSFGPLMSTEIACDQGMDIEKAFLSAMPRVGTFAFDQGHLLLSSLDGKVRLEFIKPPK